MASLYKPGGFLRSPHLTTCCILLNLLFKKANKWWWWWLHRWLPQEMTSEKQAQKFHTDDTSLPTSGKCFWLVMLRGKFLHLFLRYHFTGKPLVASRNIGCFLRLLPHEVSEMSCNCVLTIKTTQPCPQVFSVNCPVFCQLCCRINIIFHLSQTSKFGQQ